MDNTKLVDLLSERLGCEKKDAASMLDAFTHIVEERCSDMDIIALPGFGSFEPKMRKERIVVMPSTGKKMLVPPKISLTFKPSAILKQRLRESEDNL